MRRAALGLGGLVLVAGLSPWADRAADRSLVFHMVQNLALTMAAAPLLVFGAARYVERSKRQLGRPLHPAIAWSLFVGGQWALHLSGMYVFAADHPAAHLLEHAADIVTAALFWWFAVGASRRLTPVGRIVYVTLAMPALGAIGFVLDASSSVLYPGYATLAEQHAAGSLMWAAGGLLMVAALVLSAWEALRDEERRALAREAYGR